MGEVYAARDPELGRNVAIKVLPSAFSADPERLMRFEVEARAAGALNHPNLLTVHDVGREGGAPYIVAELLEGETLREALTGGPLAQRTALAYAAQLARGLSAAHERGIIHRDLKPENIFITSDGRAKILDFGLAKLTLAELDLDAQSETVGANTVYGTMMGTAGYMAPEQIRGETVDHRADIFSFGCILYEMLAGTRAFERETPVETFTATLKESPPDLPGDSRATRPMLERLVLRCLEKNPGARFQSASDLAFALETMSGSGVHQHDGFHAPQPVRSNWRRALPWLAVIAAGLLIAPAGVLWMASRNSPDAGSVRFTVPPPANGRFEWSIGVSSVISPDGRNLVLLVNADDRSQLFVRPLDDGADPRPLPGTEGGTNPFWSPDSRFVGFFTDRQLKRIDVNSGGLQTLCDLSAGQGATWHGSWGKDGTVLLSASASIYRVPAAGGDPALVAAPDPARQEISLKWVHFLPDGRHFLYTVSKADKKHEVRVGRIDSTDVRRVMQSDSRAIYAAPGYLLWVREGTLLAQRFDTAAMQLSGGPVTVAENIHYFQPTLFSDIAASNNGVLTYLSGPLRSRLVWYTRDGAQAGTIGVPADYRAPRLSSTGQRLAVNVVDPRTGTSDVHVFDLLRGPSSPVTFDPSVEWFPVWSPDEKQIAFAAERGAIPNLHVKSLSDAGGGEPLVEPGGTVQFPWDWVRTPEGQFIIYADRRQDTGADVMIVPLHGDRKPRPLLSSRFDEAEARLSPDGRWLAYVSNESGSREVYVQPFNGPAGDRWKISTNGGFTPRWRVDAKEVYYLTHEGNIMARPVGGGADPFAAQPRPLFHVNAARGDLAQYDVSRDGRFLVNVLDGDGMLRPTVVVNWTAGLHRD